MHPSGMSCRLRTARPVSVLLSTRCDPRRVERTRADTSAIQNALDLDWLCARREETNGSRAVVLKHVMECSCHEAHRISLRRCSHSRVPYSKVRREAGQERSAPTVGPSQSVLETRPPGEIEEKRTPAKLS